MNIKDALSWAENELREIPDPRLDGEYLLAYVLKKERLPMLLDKMQPLSDEDFSAYQALIARRKDREPLQWILGEQPFMGFSFKTDRRALIPRNDTEAVCETALSRIRGKMQVLDLCCGTGAIGIAVKKLRPGCDVTLCDLSEQALSLAKENADLLQADVRILQGDLFQPVQGEKFHVIVSNPPYIPDELRGKLQQEVNREPEMALFGGADGLDFYRIIAREAPRRLHEGGFLILECGDDQPEQIAGLLEDAFDEIEWIYDLNGHPRGVSARLK